MTYDFIYITPNVASLTSDYNGQIKTIGIDSMHYTTIADGLHVVTPETPGYAVKFTFLVGGSVMEPKDAGRYDIRIDVSITDPNNISNKISGHFTSVRTLTAPDNADIDICNVSKYLTINRIIGYVNPPTTPFSHVYDGFVSPVEFTTTPPNIECYVSYSTGGLIPPTDIGNYEVTIEIIDHNYITDSVFPFKSSYSIISDPAIAIRQLEQKQALLNSEASISLNSNSSSAFVTNTLLMRLDVPIIKEMSTISSISDCAKSLPDKLMKAIIVKAISAVLSYIPGLGIVNLIREITSLIAEVERIIALVDDIRKNPLTFLDSVLVSAGVYANINDQIHALEKQFPFIDDIAGILNDIDNICNKQDYSIFGLPSPGLIKTDPTKIPTAMTPTPMPKFDQKSNTAKMDYDSLLGVGHLQDAIGKDTPKMDALTKAGDNIKFSNYVSMITQVTIAVNSYHDDIKITTDASKDAILLQKYKDNVAKARHANPSWDAETLAEYDHRTLRGQSEISRNTNIIRAYFMKNTAVIGGVNSKGATTYSGPSRDFTTYLDIYPNERSASDTAYWKSKGYNTDKPWKSTLHASDAYQGAYGSIVSDQTIASCRWPGDSVIALKNPDGTPYNPIDKNPSGTYTVKDTGNAKLTYAKPDIYTDNPDAYHGLENVESFVVSLGSKTNSQYKLAQSQNASSNTNGAASNV